MKKSYMSFNHQLKKSAASPSEISINLSNYHKIRHHLQKKIIKSIKNKDFIIIKNVYFSCISLEEQTNLRQFFSFIIDIFQIMKRFPNKILIEKDAIKIDSLKGHDNSFKLLWKITKLLRLKDKKQLQETENKEISYSLNNSSDVSSALPNSSYWEAEYELMKKNYRKTGKYECNSSKEAEELNKIISVYFPHTKIIMRDPSHLDVYYSLQKRYLNEIINSDNIVDTSFIKRAGELFGYPECCATEYLRDKFHYLPSFPFKWLIKRYKSTQKINPLFNPFLSNLYYFPCTLKCPHTLKRLKIITKHILHRQKRELLFYPIIYFLPETLDAPIYRGNIGDIDYIVVKPISWDENHCTYSPLYYAKETINTKVILEGNRLYFKNGIMTIFKDKRIVHKFYLGSHIWYYKRTFDNDFTILFIKALKRVIQTLPIFIINNNSIYEVFLKTQKSLRIAQSVLKQHQIAIEDIWLNNNEILVKLKTQRFKNAKVIFSIQNASDSSKFYIKSKHLKISIKKRDSYFPENMLYPLAVFILDYIGSFKH